jgi:hypothetical protein
MRHVCSVDVAPRKRLCTFFYRIYPTGNIIYYASVLQIRHTANFAFDTWWYIPLPKTQESWGSFLYLQILQIFSIEKCNYIYVRKVISVKKSQEIFKEIVVNYWKCCGLIQLSASFGCAQVKILIRNVYTKPLVCTQEAHETRPPCICECCTLICHYFIWSCIGMIMYVVWLPNNFIQKCFHNCFNLS